MEISTKEIELAQEAVSDAKEAAVSELEAVKLALVGGGCISVVFG